MIELDVEGMSCGHCAARVTKSVQAIDAAAKVDVDLGKKKVRIDTSADAATLAAAISDAGYPAKAPVAG